ncbi:probable membrane-associated kinase regulator 6 [Hevea brasiliensis]|uniref:probable membrane-associated kinase regulator 6 n=1 Tax=Hevea brasiliensis TaxID=3981 RepID=UPI0025FB2DCE|nr:probable membrane-associated kinase regulator 6 [Hevea brasiliensis]XP_058010116.1 probable membrane-associated kinase regulator 6 [Hevea brasiliensis]
MECSQPLAVESFSHSWLTSVSSPLNGLEELLRASLDSSHEAIFEELEYKVPKPKRSLEEVQNFNFDVPSSQFPDALVHADQLFAEGLIKPVFISQSKIDTSSSLVLVPKMHSSVVSSAVVPTVDIQCCIFKRWRKSSQRILQKCVGHLRLLCRKLPGSIRTTRVDDIDRRARQVKIWSNSPQASPGITYTSTGWCDIESSIYDAVLHCKRSIGK